MQCRTVRVGWTNENENPSGLGRSGQLTRLPLATWTGLPLEGWGLQGLAPRIRGDQPYRNCPVSGRMANKSEPKPFCSEGVEKNGGRRAKPGFCLKHAAGMWETRIHGQSQGRL